MHGPDVLVAVADPLDACIAIWKPLKDVLPDYWMTAFPEEISPGWSNQSAALTWNPPPGGSIANDRMRGTRWHRFNRCRKQAVHSSSEITPALDSVLSLYIAGYESGFRVISTVAVRRPTRRQVRDLQRAVHLLTALVLLAYVYAAPLLGAGVTAAARWLVVPALALSGVALRQWHRLRTALRTRKG